MSKNLHHLIRDEITKTVKDRYTEQLGGQMITPSFVREIILIDCLTIWRELKNNRESRGETVPLIPPHLPWNLKSSRKHMAAPCRTSQA
jgi:hypothetical protein